MDVDKPDSAGSSPDVGGRSPDLAALSKAAKAAVSRVNPVHLESSTVDPEDLYQEALEVGIKLSTADDAGVHGQGYLQQAMLNRIRDVLRKEDPLPQSTRADLRALDVANAELMQETGGEVDFKLVVERAGLTVERARHVRRARYETSMQRPDLHVELEHLIADEHTVSVEESVIAAEAAVAFNTAFHSLDATDQRLIQLSLFSNGGKLSYAQMGRELGVSRQRAQFVSKRAVERLYERYKMYAGFPTS